MNRYNKRQFILQGLDCVSCAAKIEKKDGQSHIHTEFYTCLKGKIM